MVVFLVDNVTDELDGNYGAGDLSLREAINVASIGDTVSFAAGLSGQTLSLTLGELALTQDVTIDGDIDGDNKSDVTISGNNASRIFLVSGAGTDVDLNSLTLINGNTDRGGAVRALAGTTLDIADSTLSGNYAGRGGALHIYNADVTLTNSLLTGNSSQIFAGGAHFSGGSAILTNTTIYDNTSNGNGGGLGAYNTTLTLNNSTVTGNQADANGASTTDGGGVWDFFSTFNINNSVIAENTSGTALTADDVSGTIDIATNSFIGITETITVNNSTTNGGGNPLLAALADNGGTTQTLAIEQGSALINSGSNGLIPGGITEDANGNARIIASTVDIGATEFVPVVTSIIDEAADGGSLAADSADGAGLSLREAVFWAGAGDRIDFDAALAGGTIVLTRGEIVINKDLVIDGDSNGDDSADITVSGNNASRVFRIYDAGTDVDLSSLTMTNGFVYGHGGAIFVDEATVNIDNSTISNNNAAYIVSGSGRGGGIFASDAAISMTNVLLIGNQAGLLGGGAEFSVGTSATLTNVTVYGNSSNSNGGGIYTSTANTVDLFNSTIAGNQSDAGFGGGIAGAGTLNLTNTVVADNTRAGGTTNDDVFGTINSAVSSFIGTTETILFSPNTINGGGDPGLAALADNGGTTQTLELLSGSPLVGAGNAALLPNDIFDLDGDGNTVEDLPIDANGDSRVFGLLDIGAVETRNVIVVDTATDENDGDFSVGDLSLREALTLVSDGGTILFDASLAGQTLTLTQGPLSIFQSVTLDGDVDGDNVADITLSGDADLSGTHTNADSRIFNISMGAGETTRIDSLYLTEGFEHFSFGGAILFGGSGALDIVNSTISASGAFYGGGAIFSNGTLNIVNSLLLNNVSTYTSPIDNYSGGAIRLFGGTADLTNTTFYGNTSARLGGAIAVQNSSTLLLHNSTLTQNQARISSAYDVTGGGGIYTEGSATTRTYNSVVAENTSSSTLAANDTAGTVATAIKSFFGTAATIVISVGNTNGGGDPVLGELLNNGGTTLTLSPLDGSPLIDDGSNGVIPVDILDIDNDGNTAEQLPLDGRGGLRIVGGTVDIGAVEQIVDETIGGTDAGNIIIGGLGNDIIDAGNGADTLEGGAGDDILQGGLIADMINGGAGNDIIFGSFGNDTIDGGADEDEVDYSGFGGNISVNLNASPAQTSGGGGVDTITNVENARGGDFADTLTGRPDDTKLWGAAGGDKLFGIGGNDELHGGGANDNLQGGNGDDVLFGEADQDILTGGAGNDTLDGGDALDRLVGSEDNDVLIGGLGRDILRGDSFDTGTMTNITGGNDTFVFNDISESAAGGLRDIIRDLVQGEDVIDLTGIDAINGGSDDAFTFIGTGNFTNTAGELRYQFGGTHTIVSGDVTGTGTADFQIDLNGNINLLATDFVL